MQISIPVAKTVALVQAGPEELFKGYPPVVTPALVSLDNHGSELSVEVSNLSDSPLELEANAIIAELCQVTILDAPASEMGDDDFVNQFKFEQLSSEVGDGDISRLKQLLKDHKGVFAQSSLDLGRTSIVKHEIRLSDDQPFKDRPRRIPPALYEEVREHLKEMLACDVIRESSSPYSSNVVLVRKTDGSLRFCIDFRRLNQKTIRDAHALPRIEDTLDSLCGASWFSSLDLKSGYWQVELAEQDKPKTAFTAGSLGFYEFNRLPFGLTNSPATFQRLMQRVLGELHLSTCLVYLDDIVVFSRNIDEHFERLQQVLSRLSEAGLKLKPSKCHFLHRKLKYLGHIVSEKGIECNPSRTEEISNWKVPCNVKELQQFLGFSSFYRRYVQDFASIAKPLHALTGTVKGKDGRRRPVPWDWGEQQDSAFQRLVQALTSPPLLAYPDYALPFVLRIDASGNGLGAVLGQEQDGLFRVIACASRGLRKSERNYSSNKLEFLALKWAVTRKFYDYLYGNHFVVTTDNNPLTYVLTTAKLDAVGHRWLAASSLLLISSCATRVESPILMPTFFPDVPTMLCCPPLLSQRFVRMCPAWFPGKVLFTVCRRIHQCLLILCVPMRSISKVST